MPAFLSICLSADLYHCKVMIVDGLWTKVGSTKFAPRSFSLNDEATVNYYDRDFALRQIKNHFPG